MSIAPEATLAKEAGLEYAAVAMSTDYDCWKKGEKDVSADMVFKTMRENAEKVTNLIIKTIEKFSSPEINIEENEDVRIIKDSIRTIPDWPKPGVMFRDITTLLKSQEAMNKVLDILVRRYKDKGIEIIAGIEARGFIFASLLADKIGAVLVPVRKPGKLPGETEKEEYELEYGRDAVEIHKDAITPGQKVLVMDDLIATGGTSEATCKLVEKLGGRVEECAFVIELPDLKGRQKLSKWNMFSIVKFEGE